jgi:hypothetical protein
MNGREFDLTKGFRNMPQSLREIIESEENNLTVKHHPAAFGGTPPTEGNNNAPTAPVTAATPQVTAAKQNTTLDAEAIRAQARQEAIAEERRRQQAIDELAVPGMEAVIAKAKYETGDSPEAVALAIVKAQKQAGQAAFADRQGDAAVSGVNELNAAVTSDGTGSGSAAKEKAVALNAEIMKGRERK